MYFNIQKFFNFDRSHLFVSSLSTFYFQMVEEFTKSIEFNHILDVPPDFQIEIMFLNLHVWFLLNRFSDFNNSGFVGAFKNYLLNQLESYVEDNIMKLHINRKNDFILDTNHYLQNCQKFLTYHFKGNPKTISNPIYKLDALVWTLIFFEKVDRYDERVYIVANYILETYYYMQTLTIDDFKAFNMSFNVFRIPVNYRQRIEKINPPLSKAEFEAEKSKPADLKKSYRYDYNEDSALLPMDDKVE